MKLSRELKEFFYNPVFYIIAGVFLALSGYKFYSLLLSYIDLMSTYPEHLFGGEVSALLGVNVNSFIFPRLFEFYSYLAMAAVPVFSTGIGHDRTLEIDKVELMVTGLTETGLILRKIFSTTALMCMILVPTVMYPLILSPFAQVDYGVVISSYLGLCLLVFTASCVVSPLGIIRLPLGVSIFLNFIVLLVAYIYVLEPMFSSFLFGVIRLSSLAFLAVMSSALVLFSSRIYISTRLFR